MIINAIKRIIPIRFYRVLRDWKALFQQNRLSINRNEKPIIWYLDSPEYGNIGDQAIAYAIRKFLSDNVPGFDVVEILESEVSYYLRWLKKNIAKNDIIVLQGGGNFGNIYKSYESIRQVIVKTFSSNKIIIFPQSCYYSNDYLGEYEKKHAIRVYSSNSNVTIFAREQKSYEKFLKMFPKTSIKLCPDIVLYLDGLINENNKRGLGECFRSDEESLICSTEQKHFIELMEKTYSTINHIDTIANEESFIVSNRETAVLDKIREFSRNELVLTDRLHGMIFCYITNTSCVFFDSVTGKTKSMYETWFNQNGPVLSFQDRMKNNSSKKELDFSNLINCFKNISK